uniref:Uncharacterized protein n=1 Tax=Romanomermis culicivorax TaxID=13658 RepID=A0A915L1Q0_ROMCU
MLLIQVTGPDLEFCDGHCCSRNTAMQGRAFGGREATTHNPCFFEKDIALHEIKFLDETGPMELPDNGLEKSSTSIRGSCDL